MGCWVGIRMGGEGGMRRCVQGGGGAVRDHSCRGKAGRRGMRP